MAKLELIKRWETEEGREKTDIIIKALFCVWLGVSRVKRMGLPTHAGANLGVGLTAMCIGGVPGWVLEGTYVIVDNTIGWEAVVTPQHTGSGSYFDNTAGVYLPR